MAAAPKHPSTYSTSELLTMCQSERLVLEQRALTVKRQLRERAAELTTIEQWLETTHASEECLRNDKAARQLRVVK
jgi:hypothetical protein